MPYEKVQERVVASNRAKLASKKRKMRSLDSRAMHGSGVRRARKDSDAVESGWESDDYVSLSEIAARYV